MTIVLDGSAGITNDGGYTGDGVVFADTTPANTLVTDISGNVGIGTSSPSYPLDVAGIARSNAWIGRTNGSAPTADCAVYRPADSSLGFSTANTERARIDSSGRFLVNATLSFGGRLQSTGIAGSAAAASFRPGQNGDGTVEWYNASSTYVGAVTVNASTVVYGGTSDYRLKENIAPMAAALARVAALKPVTYTWKSTGEAGEGFIAHELQEVCPSAVVGEKDAVDEDGKIKPQQIDTSFLVAILTAAIQEQQAIITAQAAQIQQLREKVLEVEEGTSNMLVENTNNLYETITALTARVAALEGK